MKLLSIIFTFIALLSCSNLSPKRSPSSEHFNVVLDIDYTIVQPARDDVTKDVLIINGERYRIRPWAIELISYLSDKPNVRIHFFSGGKIDRNTKLLKKLKLKNGNSAYNVAQTIMSFSDLTQVRQDGRFSEKYKKDLPFPEHELKRTILVDDNFHFAMPDQKSNMLWIGETFHHYLNFEQSKLDFGNPEIRQEYIPGTKTHWLNSENNLLFIYHLLSDAIDSDSSGEAEFLDFIHKRRSVYVPEKEQMTMFQRRLLNPHKFSDKACQSLILSF